MASHTILLGVILRELVDRSASPAKRFVDDSVQIDTVVMVHAIEKVSSNSIEI